MTPAPEDHHPPHDRAVRGGRARAAALGIAVLAIASAVVTSVAAAHTASPLQDAVALVRSKGFTPYSTSSYKPRATLRVLVATATGSADGHVQRAFFFVRRRYIGTDGLQSSASLAYVGQSSTTVRLQYGVYGPGSADCCPSSHRTVRFHWNGHRLVALDPIP